MRRKLHVLTVSQSIGIRTLATICFTRGGHHIEAVTSRAEAMPLIAQQQPDLVILDMHLKDEPGLRLAADLRTLYPDLLMLFAPQLNEVVLEEEIQAAGELGISVLDEYTRIGSQSFYNVMHKISPQLFP
jgi:CheY-like chemotaxis protein